MGHPHWPLFDLEVRTPRITMRYVDDELAVELAGLAARGIHDPSTMPFSVPWSEVPSPQLERNTMQYYWRTRAETTPAKWDIPFAVITDGQVCGCGGVAAENFKILRSVETGSWLGKQHQRQGIGKELRAASLHLIFEGFGASFATTGAWTDNAPSLAVTRSLGYTETGRRRSVRRDRPGVLIGFEMDRAHWESIRRDDIAIDGIEQVRELLEVGAIDGP